MGYDRTGYRVYMPTTGRIAISRHVRFQDEIKGSILFEDDDAFNQLKTIQPSLFKLLESEWAMTNDHIDEYLIDTPEEFLDEEQDEIIMENESDYFSEDGDKVDSGVSITTRSGRTVKPVERYGLITHAPQRVRVKIPNSYKEAMDSPEKEEWIHAIDAELQSMANLHTYELADLPAGRKAVGSRWVYDIKTDIDGNILRFKARLVAKGFSQQHLIDYNETYSPVVDYITLRCILSLAVSLNWSLRQGDYSTAYLNGELEEIIYMSQPKGYERGNQVCLLKKAIYGLKQAGRRWYETLDPVIRAEGFTRCISDRCVYKQKLGDNLILVVLYVDDFLVLGKSVDEIEAMKQRLASKFKSRELGKVTSFLNWELNPNFK